MASDEILCSLGCGRPAKYISKYRDSKPRCEKSANSCPALRAKNSNSLKNLHRNNPNFNGKSGTGEMSGWSNFDKDHKTEIRDKAVKTRKERFQSGELVSKHLGITLSDQHKDKIRKARVNALLNNERDPSGKGKRGFYDGIYFHSSWELAYYIWMKEVKNTILKRNTKVKFKYRIGSSIHSYIPDFTGPNGEIYEIKGHLYNNNDKIKYELFHDRVIFLFKKELTEAILYCINKYTKDFTVVLYEK